MTDTAIDVEALRVSPIVKDLSPAAPTDLAARGMSLTLKDGDPLRFQDVRGGLGLFLLLSGSIGVYRRNNDGGETQLAVLTRGDCLGEYSLLDGQPISATARALESARLFFLPNGQFRAITTQNPSVGCLLYRNLARYLVKRLRAQ
ncbi:cyclic nucleotide-binding domain-containing protein [Sinimarinibacterium thermocellulolyticum]|uniref:Cyclic nucleotide-binding domain-containing protein n=1 Tax=Sinimarinibacterium thermocellulolyticum TaxID=3170016 RepID=A0ABV2A8G6_9GAMM